MSTQINITVDSGGLTDRAKQQQQAARQAQLEKERTLNLSAEALDKRVAAQAAKGQSLDGQPLYSAGFKEPQVERRPAASRTAGGPVLLTPKGQPIGTTQITAPLTTAQGLADSALPNVLKYVENNNSWYPRQFPENYSGYAIDFAPVAGQKSIRPSPGRTIETYGSKKGISITAGGSYTYEWWEFFGNVDILGRQDLSLRTNLENQGITSPNDLDNITITALNAWLDYSAQVYRPELTWLAVSPQNPNAYEVFTIASNDFGITAPTQTWCHLCLMADSTLIRYYMNGVLAGFIGRQEGPIDCSPAFGPYSSAVLSMFFSYEENPIHKIRYTPSLRYPVEGFTPDPNF